MLRTIVVAFLIVILTTRILSPTFSFLSNMISPRRRRNPRRQQPVPRPASPALSSEDFTQDDTSYEPSSFHDVYHMTFLLRQILLPELVPQILNDAEYWLKTTNARSDDVNISQSEAGFVYLRSQQVTAIIHHAVRRVEFTITSRDQGWADNSSNSWTWFEAGIHRRFEHEGDDHSQEMTMKRRLCENVAASRENRMYSVVWKFDSENEEEREWLRALSSGDSIVLTVHARFPGWTNKVHSAEIKVYTAGVNR